MEVAHAMEYLLQELADRVMGLELREAIRAAGGDVGVLPAEKAASDAPIMEKHAMAQELDQLKHDVHELKDLLGMNTDQVNQTNLVVFDCKRGMEALKATMDAMSTEIWNLMDARQHVEATTAAEISNQRRDIGDIHESLDKLREELNSLVEKSSLHEVHIQKSSDAVQKIEKQRSIDEQQQKSLNSSSESNLFDFVAAIRSDLERNVADAEARLKNDISQIQQEAFGKVSVLEQQKILEKQLGEQVKILGDHARDILQLREQETCVTEQLAEFRSAGISQCLGDNTRDILQLQEEVKCLTEKSSLHGLALQQTSETVQKMEQRQATDDQKWKDHMDSVHDRVAVLHSDLGRNVADAEARLKNDISQVQQQALGKIGALEQLAELRRAEVSGDAVQMIERQREEDEKKWKAHMDSVHDVLATKVDKKPFEDLKHCTASLTKGVVKFAQVVGVFSAPKLKGADGEHQGEVDEELLGWEECAKNMPFCVKQQEALGDQKRDILRLREEVDGLTETSCLYGLELKQTSNAVWKMGQLRDNDAQNWKDQMDTIRYILDTKVNQKTFQDLEHRTASLTKGVVKFAQVVGVFSGLEPEEAADVELVSWEKCAEKMCFCVDKAWQERCPQPFQNILDLVATQERLQDTKKSLSDCLNQVAVLGSDLERNVADAEARLKNDLRQVQQETFEKIGSLEQQAELRSAEVSRCLGDQKRSILQLREEVCCVTEKSSLHGLELQQTSGAVRKIEQQQVTDEQNWKALVDSVHHILHTKVDKKPFEDLEHCTASLTRGVAKFAHVVGVFSGSTLDDEGWEECAKNMLFRVDRAWQQRCSQATGNHSDLFTAKESPCTSQKSLNDCFNEVAIIRSDLEKNVAAAFERIGALEQQAELRSAEAPQYLGPLASAPYMSSTPLQDVHGQEALGDQTRDILQLREEVKCLTEKNYLYGLELQQTRDAVQRIEQENWQTQMDAVRVSLHAKVDKKPFEDLELCTASLTKGVVKFAQVVGVFPSSKLDDADRAGAELGEAGAELGEGWKEYAKNMSVCVDRAWRQSCSQPFRNIWQTVREIQDGYSLGRSSNRESSAARLADRATPVQGRLRSSGSKQKVSSPVSASGVMDESTNASVPPSGCMQLDNSWSESAVSLEKRATSRSASSGRSTAPPSRERLEEKVS